MNSAVCNNDMKNYIYDELKNDGTTVDRPTKHSNSYAL